MVNLKLLRTARWKPFFYWRVLPRWRNFLGKSSYTLRRFRWPHLFLLAFLGLASFFLLKAAGGGISFLKRYPQVTVETAPVPPLDTHLPAPGLAESPSFSEGNTKKQGEERPVSQETPSSSKKETLAPGEETVTFQLPLAGELSRGFGFGYDPTYEDFRYHQGIDLNAPVGTIVKAVAAGEVKKIVYTEEWGYQVFLTHAGNWETSYAHLTAVSVKPAEKVEPGTPLGKLGNPGRAERGQAPHLHLEFFRAGKVYNPGDFFGF